MMQELLCSGPADKKTTGNVIPVLHVWPERGSKNQAVIKLVRVLVVCANSVPASGGQIH